VLLDIGVDDEKGDAGSLKLAKDRHVCFQTPQKVLKFLVLIIYIDRPNPTTIRRS
jgi:hypothetical protein